MATVPSFRTWVTGEVVTAAELNSNIRDAGNFFLSVPVFEGRQTVAQSIPNSTVTAITLDTESVDTDNGHSTSTNTSRYTPQTAGRFQISGGVTYASNSTGNREADLYQNGGSITNGVNNTNAVSTNVTRLATRTLTITCNGTTDYLEVYGFQTSGGALNTFAGESFMSVRFVGTT